MKQIGKFVVGVFEDGALEGTLIVSDRRISNAVRDGKIKVVEVRDVHVSQVCENAMMKCSYCSRELDGTTIFHDSYVTHVLKDGEYVPVFCDEGCAIAWIAARKKQPISEVMKDYENWLEAMG